MDDLIYNQQDIPREQWRYGLRSSAATGCGWIAAYNALRLMHYRVEPATLIRNFERLLPVIHGNLGTSLPAPALFFRLQGFPVTVSANPKKFDDLAKSHDVCILFYHWRNRWKLGAHFVALQYQDSSFIGYNTYRNSTGPDRYGPSLAAFLRKRKYVTPVLIAIRDKRSSAPKAAEGLPPLREK